MEKGRPRTHLHINLVTAQDNGDALADALEVAVPVGHVFVGNPRSHVEHNNTTLALDVVAISQTTELFLAGSVPYIKADVTKVGMEVERVDLDTKGGCLNESVYELQSAKMGDQACGKGAEFVATGWSGSLTNIFLFKFTGHMALLDTMSMCISRSH